MRITALRFAQVDTFLDRNDSNNSLLSPRLIFCYGGITRLIADKFDGNTERKE